LNIPNATKWREHKLRLDEEQDKRRATMQQQIIESMFAKIDVDTDCLEFELEEPLSKSLAEQIKIKGFEICQWSRINNRSSKSVWAVEIRVNCKNHINMMQVQRALINDG